ncbi:MAG: hypothetical protein WKF68_09905 [Daejeonella sp.]
MMMRITVRSRQVIVLFLCFFNFSAYAISSALQDTSITERQKANLSFNSIYRQNANSGFFGNEYGNKIRSTLVADVNPNVVLLSSKDSRFFALISPRVKLRLLDARKSPVRSPSYMPGAKVYFRIGDNVMRPDFFSLAYSHHSNGQDGPTLDSAGNFNRGEGKFTTNFYTLDYAIGKRKVNSATAQSHYSSIGIELHTGLFNKGYSKELDGNYGFVRINGSWNFDMLKGRSGNEKYDSHQRLHARFTYIADRYENYDLVNFRKRLNATIQYSYQFGFMDNVAFALGAGYRAQDDYNIYFEDSYSFVSVGIVYGVTFDLDKKRYSGGK